MLKTPSADRTSRHQSASSRSSLATVRPLEHSRSPSRSRARPSSGTTGPWNSHNASIDDAAVPPPKRARSSSTKRASDHSAKKVDNDIPIPAHRLSQSASSTSSKDYRRRSSLSARLGLSSSSPSSKTGMTRREPSPPRKRRPADIVVHPASTISLAAKGATLAPTDLLPQGGTFYTLESPMFMSDRPRTPLLHDGQFGADIPSAVGLREEERDNAFRAPQNWSSEIFQGGALSRSSNEFPGSIPAIDTSGSVITDDSPTDRTTYLDPRRRIPEMTQRRIQLPLRSPAQFNFQPPSGASSESEHRTSPRRRAQKDPRDIDRDKKKNMLASALQRATEAVELDNTHDYTAALTAYLEACEYLSQVANKSSSEGDKQKLRDIRNQYTVRIREIQLLEAGNPGTFAAANRGEAGEPDDGVDIRPSLDGPLDEEAPIVETARVTRIVDHMPSRQEGSGDATDSGQKSMRSTSQAMLSIPQSDRFMPAPLSPRRPPPQPPLEEPTDPVASAQVDSPLARDSTILVHQADSHMSWLDGAEEPPSPHSSRHSVSSLNELRRKHLRMHSTSTEAEFDAALDAAVEAAYDDGYEPFNENGRRLSARLMPRTSRQGSSASNDAYLAGRADRMLAQAKSQSDRQRQHQAGISQSDKAHAHDTGLDSDEEAERILNKAHDSLASAASRDSQSKTTMPRQSDSSSSSGRTWGSSAASSLGTIGTSLSTVDEDTLLSRSKLPISTAHPPPAPPPKGALPTPPGRGQSAASHSHTSHAQQKSSSGQRTTLQDRRLSGRKGKLLTIETSVSGSSEDDASPYRTDGPGLRKRSEHDISQVPKTATGALPTDLRTVDESPRQEVSARLPAGIRQISSPFHTPFQATFSDFSGSSTISPSETNLTSALSNDSSSIRASPFAGSPNDPFSKQLDGRTLLKNNGSSLSLRNKGLLTPGSDTEFRSPITPLSSTFSANIAETFDDIRSQSQTKASAAKPRPLEPCPESQLLRPYWLMRCFYQTLTHPDGGFLTTTLCIPKRVWLVANVKLKYVDDKVSNCDLLTAALLKLGSIDTLDADAVLAELEAFEAVMSQAQTNLSKKLGNDVGAQNISMLFKEAPTTSVTSPGDALTRQETTGDTAGNTNSTGSGKSSSRGYFSLRKLRGKASDTALAKSYTSVKEATSTEGLKMSTVPMTGSLQAPSVRTAKRDGRPISPIGEVRGEGPNGNYMGALAKLCDAVQVLDQIARQVEDPGLKHSSPTHVGLELSSKHASEFFGLYICRFVLQDITMLAEKHVKRASEYVLA